MGVGHNFGTGSSNIGSIVLLVSRDKSSADVDECNSLEANRVVLFYKWGRGSPWDSQLLPPPQGPRLWSELHCRLLAGTEQVRVEEIKNVSCPFSQGTHFMLMECFAAMI